MEYSNLFVCLMGIGTVFFALSMIVVLTKIMSAIIGKEAAPAPVANVSTAPAVAPAPKDPAMMAAISAAIAEELGTDIAAIRIHSIKRI